ncbi:hypothetical protein AB0F45_31530, partial [Streptomyces achromogenes]
MAPRRRRRPWYRTRAYRLARTAVLVTVLVTVGSRCTGQDGPATAGRAGGADEAAACLTVTLEGRRPLVAEVQA